MTEASAATSGLLFSVVVGRHRAAVQQPTLWQQKIIQNPNFIQFLRSKQTTKNRQVLEVQVERAGGGVAGGFP